MQQAAVACYPHRRVQKCKQLHPRRCPRAWPWDSQNHLRQKRSNRSSRISRCMPRTLLKAQPTLAPTHPRQRVDEAHAAPLGLDIHAVHSTQVLLLPPTTMTKQGPKSLLPGCRVQLPSPSFQSSWLATQNLSRQYNPIRHQRLSLPPPRQPR